MSTFEDRHVHRRFRTVAREHASRAALTFWTGSCWRTWSYTDLRERAEDITRALADLGTPAGSGVGLVAHRFPGTIAAMLGILGRGCHFVPLDPTQPAARTAELVATANVAVVVEARPADSTEPPFTITKVAGVTAAAKEPADATGESPEDVAYVMFTSGSTGRPKGVVVPHRGITRLVSGQDYARFGPDRVFLHAAPLSFDASTLEIWGALLHGGRCVLYPSGTLPTAEGLRNLVAATGVTTAWLTASLFHALVDRDPASLTGIEDLLVGGEAISPSHVRRALDSLPGTRIINGYGPTENTTFSTCHIVPRDLPHDAARVPIGKAIRGTQTMVVDEELRPVRAGTEGELLVMGEGLALGYLGAPDLTRQQFVEVTCGDGGARRAYRTGDRVVELDGGVLDFLGRRDDQVKIHGYRIEPQEVETAIAGLEAVRQCRVVVQRDANGQARLLAYLVLRDGANLAAVRSALPGRLPAYMVPHQVVALAALPLNANGKLAVDALPTTAAPKPASGRRPQHLVLVEQVWAEVLGRDPDSADINFFDAGGRSLDAIRLHDLLERRFNLTIDPTFPFEFPTPRRQATRLAELLATH